ncbi:MAG: hypothetical protein V1492_05430 [Candidatus Micrarchaeota archaeon]
MDKINSKRDDLFVQLGNILKPGQTKQERDDAYKSFEIYLKRENEFVPVEVREQILTYFAAFIKDAQPKLEKTAEMYNAHVTGLVNKDVMTVKAAEKKLTNEFGNETTTELLAYGIRKAALRLASDKGIKKEKAFEEVARTALQAGGLTAAAVYDVASEFGMSKADLKALAPPAATKEMGRQMATEAARLATRATKEADKRIADAEKEKKQRADDEAEHLAKAENEEDVSPFGSTRGRLKVKPVKIDQDLA